MPARSVSGKFRSPHAAWRCPARGRGFAARGATHCGAQAAIELLRPLPHAWRWVPALALKGGSPEVLVSLALPAPVQSPRVRELAEARPGCWMHDVLVPDAAAVDGQLVTSLQAAHEAAK